MTTLLDRRLIRHMPQWARDIILDTASQHGVSPADIMGPTRVKTVVTARREAIYRVKAEKPMLSTTQIGRWFRRDHTTILYAISRYQCETGASVLSRYQWRAAA